MLALDSAFYNFRHYFGLGEELGKPFVQRFDAGSPCLPHFDFSSPRTLKFEREHHDHALHSL